MARMAGRASRSRALCGCTRSRTPREPDPFLSIPPMDRVAAMADDPAANRGDRNRRRFSVHGDARQRRRLEPPGTIFSSTHRLARRQMHSAKPARNGDCRHTTGTAARRNDFEWLRMRARRQSDLYDGFRVDHLVGFYRTYVRPLDGSPPFFMPSGGACASRTGRDGDAHHDRHRRRRQRRRSRHRP